MVDRYQQLVTSGLGQQLAGALGLPVPAELRRYTPGAPVVPGSALLGGAPDGQLLATARRMLADANVTEETGDGRVAALLFDASGITESGQLRELYDFFHPALRRLQPSGRVLLLAAPVSGGARRTAVQRALDGFVRSLGKELRDGATANLVRVADGAEEGLASTLRFFLSGRSAFVAGQVVQVAPTNGVPQRPADWERPLADQVAVVTGAAQGIGAAIAEVLGRDGARVVCLDIPAQGHHLAAVANRVGGSSLQLDVTSAAAPSVLAGHMRERHDGVDVVVHNAGITRDKTIAGMDADRWDRVIDVNLSSQERLNDALLGDDVLRAGGRIVSVSSLSGIAGNRGQTNYAASKAGVIGMVEGLAPELARRGGTINAVAPGFIETALTAEMPFALREVGRRANSLNQGGRPVDVAETIAWLATRGSAWVNGNVVRVCGQSLLGA